MISKDDVVSHFLSQTAMAVALVAQRKGGEGGGERKAEIEAIASGYMEALLRATRGSQCRFRVRVTRLLR